MTWPEAVPWSRPPSVLLVEDDATSQFTITMMLQVLGCGCRLAEDGNQAIAAIAEETFDLVLMDCRMPICDGYTATRIIRERAAASGTRRLPIIAVTANVFLEDRDRCHVAGMDDFIAKPCSMERLRTCLLYWAAALAPSPATSARS